VRECGKSVVESPAARNASASSMRMSPSRRYCLRPFRGGLHRDVNATTFFPSPLSLSLSLSLTLAEIFATDRHSELASSASIRVASSIHARSLRIPRTPTSLHILIARRTHDEVHLPRHLRQPKRSSVIRAAYGRAGFSKQMSA